MHKAIPDDSSILDAHVARQLMHESQLHSRELDALKEEKREELAEEVCHTILASIELAASEGRTHTEYLLKDRQIPVDHRSSVVQRVAGLLDERGFNVICYWRFSFFGSGTLFQIEW